MKTLLRAMLITLGLCVLPATLQVAWAKCYCTWYGQPMCDGKCHTTCTFGSCGSDRVWQNNQQKKALEDYVALTRDMGLYDVSDTAMDAFEGLVNQDVVSFTEGSQRHAAALAALSEDQWLLLEQQTKEMGFVLKNGRACSSALVIDQQSKQDTACVSP